MRDLQNLPPGRHHSIDRTAFVHTDVRIPKGRRHIADMHHVCMAKVNDRIAVRMSRFWMKDEYLLAVEVQRHAVAVCPYRKTCAGHALPHVLVRDDHGSQS